MLNRTILLGFVDLPGRAEAGPGTGVVVCELDTFDKELTRRRAVADFGGMICPWLARSTVHSSCVASYQQTILLPAGSSTDEFKGVTIDGFVGFGILFSWIKIAPVKQGPVLSTRRGR